MSRYDRSYHALYNEDYQFQTLAEYKTYLSAVYRYSDDKLDYVIEQSLRHASDLFFLTRFTCKRKGTIQVIIEQPTESDRTRLLSILDRFYASYEGFQTKEQDENVYVLMNDVLSPFYDALVHKMVSPQIRQLKLLL